MRAEQSIIVLRQGIAIFVVMLAGSAFIPWFENAADFETTDIGRYLSRMISVPLARAAPPGTASVASQPMRPDLQALVNEHMARREVYVRYRTDSPDLKWIIGNQQISCVR